MFYVTDINSIIEKSPSVVTLGKFDGLHKGHMKIFKRAREIAATYDCDFSVFTFSVSPQVVISHQNNQVLMTSKERQKMIEAAGADLLAECPFTEELRSMEAEEFIREILLKKFRAKAVITGRDFRFGKDRLGDTALLARCGIKYCFYSESVEKERDGGREISSTLIKEEIRAGNMETAGRLLGYDYYLSGTVTDGKRLGRTIGFPTANLIPAPEKILPPYGVYSSVTLVRDRLYKSITNIGIKPTVQDGTCSAETFIIGFDEDIYGEDIKVSLLRGMRPEHKFDSVGELKEQMEKDLKERMDYEK